MNALRAALALIAFAPLSPLAGQQAGQDSLNPTAWGVVYDVPATRRVVLRGDVPYMRGARGDLTLDVYLPPGLRQGERRGAVVFINAVGDGADSTEKVKDWAIYRSWPRLVAAHGLVGISMDADRDRIQESLRGVFRYLGARGSEVGVDASRLAVYAASANVSGAAALLLGDSAPPGVRAAAFFYGGVPDQALRRDLPVLFIVAESDAPRMGPGLGALWQRVTEARAPWTLLYGSDMPHAFDAFTDSDPSRRILQQAIAFWKSHLDPMPARSERPSEARAIVASLYGNDAARSAELLSRWTAAYPRDAEAWRQYARVLVTLQRFGGADTAYGRAYALDSTHAGVLSGMGQMRIGQQRWAEGAGLLQRAIAGGVEHSLIYGQLGWAQLHLNRNEEAARSYERAFELGIPPGRSTRGVAWYNLACAYARLGRLDRAFEALGRAIDEGVNDRATFEEDGDLAPLRADPRFAQIRQRLTAAPPRAG